MAGDNKRKRVTKEETRLAKKQKAACDPDAPKHPMSAYMLFVQKKRTEVVKAHPCLSGKQVVSKIGELWHEATDAEKKLFLAKAEVERACYAKEAAKYKKVADAKAPPKCPMSAYMQFAKECGAVLCSKHLSWGIGEVGKKLGSEWANITDAQKKKYELLASKDAVRYAKEKVIYECKFGKIPVKKCCVTKKKKKE
jgi:hypothetical protein